MNACCSHENMTDKEIVQSLIEKNDEVTRHFFFEKCRPLFLSVMRKVFSYEVDYDEFVNEFYIHLMENDAYRLRQFQGRSSVYQWMKVVAIRYFIARRDNMIDDSSKETLLDCAARTETVDSEKRTAAVMDIRRLLDRLANRRYAYVIKRMILDDAEPKVVADELGVSIDNLYNIKKRALTALTGIALNEMEKYEKVCK